jgi:hypothetical protein
MWHVPFIVQSCNMFRGVFAETRASWKALPEFTVEVALCSRLFCVSFCFLFSDIFATILKCDNHTVLSLGPWPNIVPLSSCSVANACLFVFFLVVRRPRRRSRTSFGVCLFSCFPRLPLVDMISAAWLATRLNDSLRASDLRAHLTAAGARGCAGGGRRNGRRSAARPLAHPAAARPAEPHQYRVRRARVFVLVCVCVCVCVCVVSVFVNLL